MSPKFYKKMFCQYFFAKKCKPKLYPLKSCAKNFRIKKAPCQIDTRGQFHPYFTSKNVLSIFLCKKVTQIVCRLKAAHENVS